jgi:valyl-tRNA synthetase
MELLQELVTSVRRVRALTMVGERKRLVAVVSAPRDDERAVLEKHRAAAASLAYLARLDIEPRAARPAGSAVAVAAGFETFVPLGDDVDLDKLKEVLQNRRGKVERALAQLEKKLGNEAFVQRADPDVVAAERERLAELAHEGVLLGRNLEGF